MLSKEMVFSLVRLLTIFALVFVVFSAIAGDFEVKIEGRTMVIYAASETTVGVKLKVIADKSLPNPLLANFSAFDKDGFQIAVDIDDPQITVTDDTDYAMRTSTVRQLDVNISVTINDGTVARVVITVPKTATTDPTVPASDSMSKVVHHTITLSAAPVANFDIPKVVSIQRLRPSTQTVTSAFEESEVRGSFDVRIVLTEEPYDFKLDTINVEGGTASNLVVGVPFAWHGGRNADGSRNPAETVRPHPSEGRYAHSGTGALAGVPAGADGVTVPLPSGDDDMYHQYRVTITPHYGVAMVKISIKEFHDNGSPILNVYTPINVEHKPNGREQLRLAVATDFATIGAEATLDPTHKESTQVTAANGTPGEDISSKNAGGSGTTKVDAVEEVDTSVSIPMEGQIYISEIMFARGVHGTLPQWIEISNGSRTEQVNLSGWTLTVENTPVDADVSVGTKAVFTIPEGTRIDPSGQSNTPSTVLIVTDTGRNNLDGWMADNQVLNLWVDRQVELIPLNVTNRRYSLLSDMAFRITLAPPTGLIVTEQQGTARAVATDVVGNLADDGTVAWALPTSEGSARSSMIRRHASVSTGPAEPKDGTMMTSWVLASDTGFTQSTHLKGQRYYGLPTDIGTPGFRAGGALPVEFSHFRPERQKDTGAVVITWSTQSELNNAGFFIKRSQQRDGEFKVVNATIVPGAGTASEKQFYIYEDTTARPDVVYYYQIEDVSFDGDRRTLTRRVRLKGHVGAAGKKIATWGELKTSDQ